jgi:hypothetical protein
MITKTFATHAVFSMGTTATFPSPPGVQTPWHRTLAKVGLALFCIYVASLYVLALDQQFHWGLFPTKVDRQLTAEVKQLGDSSLTAEKRQSVEDDIISWNTFSVPVLIKAIESGPPNVRDPAAQCLQQISQKFYGVDITSLGTDPAKLQAWWDKLQADWAKAESEQK